MLCMMRSEIKLAASSACLIIFADESMFTTSSRITHSYSSRRSNIRVSEALQSNAALAVVAGVSSENGLEGYLIKPKSIDSDSFLEFIEDLRLRRKGRTVALFFWQLLGSQKQKSPGLLKRPRYNQHLQHPILSSVQSNLESIGNCQKQL